MTPDPFDIMEAIVFLICAGTIWWQGRKITQLRKEVSRYQRMRWDDWLTKYARKP